MSRRIETGRGAWAVHPETLTRHFGPVRTVEQLTLEVPTETIFGFLGPNGAGKTTTIGLLLCTIAPEVNPATILPAVSFRDQLDIDSMDFLNFLVAVDKELHVDIPEGDYAQIRTLNDWDMFSSPHPSTDPAKTTLDQRLDAMAWALFFIMLGILAWLAPEVAPKGLWLIGAGLILLGVNGVRYIKGLRLSTFTVILGVIATGVGVSTALGVSVPVLPLLLLTVGLGLLAGALFERHPA